MELLSLHYKDKKVFPFKTYVTRLKEQFRVLEKDKHASYSESQQVETLLRGMNTTDAGIEAAKTTVLHSMQYNFDRASEFMSAYILSKHAEAQHAYANSQATGGQRCNISAAGPKVDRGGRGRGGRSGQQSVRISGRGRGGRGQTNGHTRACIDTLTSPTPTATLQPHIGKSLERCEASFCRCAKVVAVVTVEEMTINRLPTALHNALPVWSR